MPRGVTPKGEDRNENKYQRYKRDWGISVKKAIGTRNYREAVTTESSIIEDRLISFLYKVGAFKDKPQDKVLLTPMNKLIELWKEYAKEPLEDRFLGDLHQAVSDWAQRRNRISHGRAGSVKSLPGEEHANPHEFEEFARLTAIDGVRIVKSVQNWYGREKRRRIREGTPIE